VIESPQKIRETSLNFRTIAHEASLPIERHERPAEEDGMGTIVCKTMPCFEQKVGFIPARTGRFKTDVQQICGRSSADSQQTHGNSITNVQQIDSNFAADLE
jgi:hypothetical protein